MDDPGPLTGIAVSWGLDSTGQVQWFSGKYDKQALRGESRDLYISLVSAVPFLSACGEMTEITMTS